MKFRLVEKLDRKVTWEELVELEKDLYTKLRENNIYPEDGTFREGITTDLILELYIDGDWKHDHLFAEHIVNEFCTERTFTIIHKTNHEIGQSASDWYKSKHTWYINMPKE